MCDYIQEIRTHERQSIVEELLAKANRAASLPTERRDRPNDVDETASYLRWVAMLIKNGIQ